MTLAASCGLATLHFSPTGFNQTAGGIVGQIVGNNLAGVMKPLGATVLLFDGNPFYPDEGALFQLADDEKMTMFGTSARYLSAVEKAGLEPRDTFDLATVKAMCLTSAMVSTPW